jgi:peptidoglycan/xylan/chitin deacetylase (PgdA/CDA1 family)
MTVRRIGKLRRVARRLKRRFMPTGLILMYHRVAEVDSDPWSLCVQPRHFAQHLEVLQKYGWTLPLPQFTQAHRQGNLPHRAVAVTFDDGYADNLLNAKPLLEQHNIPATVFLTSGCIGQSREFWWDDLERLLLQPGTLPQTLRLNITGNTHEWDLGEAARYSKTEHQRDRHLKPWDSQPGSRLFFFYSLWQHLYPLPDVEQQQVLAELIAWAGAQPIARPTHRTLSPEEVRVLGQGELVEIGAHTVTHPSLPAHSVTVQRDEIQQSKAYLEELLSRSVTSFSYPYGDYTTETAALVQEFGFSCACSTVEDVVSRQSNAFQLPRCEVHNWTGEEFEKRLLEWFRG